MYILDICNHIRRVFELATDYCLKDFPFSLREEAKKKKTRVGPPNKHLLCTRHAFVWVTHSWWVYRRADCNNPALLTWILHGDARWLCGRVGEALWMISSGPWVHYDQSRSANLAKCLSAVCRTPQPFLPPWESEGRHGEQTSPCSCPRDQD